MDRKTDGGIFKTGSNKFRQIKKQNRDKRTNKLITDVMTEEEIVVKIKHSVTEI